MSNAAVPDFEARVDTLIPSLAGGDLAAKEREVALKRLAWLEQRGLSRPPGWPEPALPLSPRAAFELFFFEYMGFAPEQVPVVEEGDSRITWLSTNPCPTLEACTRLYLDTRVICRAVYERPTQAFLSQLDPSLRFVRDYSALRPNAPHCRESILRVDLQDLMRQAITEAQAAKAEGNKGYGAVLVWEDRVLTRAHDTACTDGDPSRHGELKSIREAALALGTPDLRGALLVSTCEPCPMCAGLAVWANVTTIVYGASIADTAAMGRTRIMLPAAEVADRAPGHMEVIGGVLKDECERLYA
jgi:tRNA(adenine34) deaminase